MKPSSEYVSEAHEHRRRHEYQLAGDYYSIAGYASLATEWDTIRADDVSHLQKGDVLKAFVWQEYAATCYRLAGLPSRVDNRARQGILGLEDVRNTVVEHQAWLGLTWELAADLRVIADLPGSEEAYETASEHYREVEASSTDSQLLGWVGEPGFNETMLYLVTLAEGVGVELEMNDVRLDDETASLLPHLEYKRERLAELLETLDAQGVWKSEQMSDPDQNVDNHEDE